MNHFEFKKILKACISDIGFKYCKKNYYYQSEELIAVINVQKSNYDDSYYVNYGFCVKAIHDRLEYPKINECDIIGRFVNETNGGAEYEFQLSTINPDELTKCFICNTEHIIIPIVNEGINKYFELFPKAIFAAKLKLKEYLENCI